jgi:hypothetical protein
MSRDSGDSPCGHGENGDSPVAQLAPEPGWIKAGYLMGAQVRSRVRGKDRHTKNVPTHPNPAATQLTRITLSPMSVRRLSPPLLSEARKPTNSRNAPNAASKEAAVRYDAIRGFGEVSSRLSTRRCTGSGPRSHETDRGLRCGGASWRLSELDQLPRELLSNHSLVPTTMPARLCFTREVPFGIRRPHRPSSQRCRGPLGAR